MSPTAIVPMPPAHPQALRRTARPALPLAALALGALLASCSLVEPPGGQPSRPAPTPASGPDRTAGRPADPAALVAAARAAEADALKSAGEARERALAEAVRRWLAAGDGGAAARLYSQLGPGTPPQVHRVLLGADVALAQGQPARATALLNQLKPPLPPGSEPGVLEVRSRIAFATGKALEGTSLAVSRERLLATEALPAARARLWDGLRAAATRGADLSAPPGTEPVTAGWLDLARQAQLGDRSPAQRVTLLREWQRRNPQHPANAAFVSAMLQAPAVSADYPARVALLLPVTGRAQVAGGALRDGFLAAFYAQPTGQRPRVQVYDTATDAAAAYQQAVADGAEVVVGPLTKDEVTSVARVADGRVTVLALNFLPDGASAPSRFYQYSLAPEDEAAQVARRLVAEGRRNGIALVPQGEWGQRVLQAFESTLRPGGGRLLATRVYATDTTDFTAPILQLLGVEDGKARHKRLVQATGTPLQFNPRRRSNIEFVFMAGQPQAARLIRPQLRFHFAGDLPVYSTAEVFDPNPRANVDLEGVMFPDMPWMIAPEPGQPDVRNALQAAWPDRLRRRGRLYAMGFDAYRIMAELRAGRDAFREPVQGMTGRLSVDLDRRIHRELEWLQLREGEPRVLPPADFAGGGR